MGPGAGADPTRRTVLAGAVLAALTATVGCLADGDDPDRTSRRRRFPGDPGPGRLYLGATVPLDEPVSQSLLFGSGGLTMTRRFYRAHQLEAMATAVAGDVAARVLPFVSCKLPGSWHALAAGEERPWLDRLLGLLDDTGSDVWLALHHEPENDGAGPADAAAWVAMQQHLIARAAQVAPRVTPVPVLMQWTFTRDSGRDPRQWLVPEARLLGVDVYNRWRPGGHGRWEEFSTMLERVRATVPDVPLVIPEVGCRPDPDDPLRAPNWLRNAFQFSVRNDIVGLAYFDSEHQEDLSFRLDPARWQAWSALTARPELARPERPARAQERT